MTDNNWISVKDRLPELNRRVTLLDGSAPVHGRRTEDEPGDDYYHDDYMVQLRLVTHWQPLPEPPVAEQEADHD